MARKLTNDRTITAYIGEDTVQWYYIRFEDSGNANFYIEPKFSALDIDLYVYESDMTTLLGDSRKGTGKSELVNIPVKADEKYYIKVKHYKGPSPGKYEIRSKVYADNTSGEEYDLAIKSITPDISEPFSVGEEVRFKVVVGNGGTEESPKYRVAVYDKRGNELDHDGEPRLEALDEESAFLYLNMNKAGDHRLKFTVEIDGKIVDKEYRTYEWSEGEEILLSMKQYFQNKQSWSNDIMKTCGKAIGPVGCALTSFAMITDYYGFNDDPGEVNKKLGNYACPINYIQAGERYNLKANYLRDNNGITRRKAEQFILEALRKDRPVLVGFKYSGGTHFVVARGYSEKEDKFHIYDPSHHKDYRFLSDYYSDGYNVHRLYEYSE